MKLKQVIKKGGVMFAASVMVLPTIATPVYATDLYPGHSYVPLDNTGAPVFYISKIDPTNNQLEFYHNSGWGENIEVDTVEVGWIADRSAVNINRDILSYDSARNTWSQTVFSGESKISNYLTQEDGDIKRYTVDTEVALSNNVFKDLFYIVNLTDGTKWINTVDYGDCGYNWSYGMSCDVMSYIPGFEYNNILYDLKNVEIKQPVSEQISGGTDASTDVTTDEQTNNETNNETASGETLEEKTEEKVDEPETETQPETIAVDETAVPLTEENIKEINEKTVETADPTDEQSMADVVEANDNTETEVVEKTASELKAVTAVVRTNMNSDTTDETEYEEGDDEAEDEDEDEDEIDFSPEGNGDTTLDVPLLGKTEQIESSLVFNWIPYFIGGAAVGTILTLILNSIIKRRKYSFLN